MRPRQWTAFEEFVLGHGDALVRLSFALCGDRGKAEDATQEALTRVYLRWSRLADPLPYARRAVVNATRDSWRHQAGGSSASRWWPGTRPTCPLRSTTWSSTGTG